MRIIRDAHKLTSLEDFADQYDLDMYVKENAPGTVDQNYRFEAHLKGVWVKTSITVEPVYGYGSSEYLAMADYAKKIGGKTLSVHSYVGMNNLVIVAPFFDGVGRDSDGE